MAGNQMMQALGIGRARPGAELQSVARVAVAEGQARAAAEAQIAAALFQIGAHGRAPGFAKGQGLEPGVAARHHQQRGRDGAFVCPARARLA